MDKEKISLYEKDGILFKLSPETIMQLLELANQFKISPSKVVENAINFTSFYKEFLSENMKPKFNKIENKKDNIDLEVSKISAEKNVLNVEISKLEAEKKDLEQKLISEKESLITLKQNLIKEEKRKREREIKRLQEQLERLVRKNQLDEKREDKTLESEIADLEALKKETKQKTKDKSFGSIKVF